MENEQSNIDDQRNIDDLFDELLGDDKEDFQLFNAVLDEVIKLDHNKKIKLLQALGTCEDIEMAEWIEILAGKTRVDQFRTMLKKGQENDNEQ